MMAALFRAAGVLMFGTLLTLGATVAGAEGWGADDDLSGTVSVRDGSAGAGRVFVGGGVIGGK